MGAGWVSETGCPSDLHPSAAAAVVGCSTYVEVEYPAPTAGSNYSNQPQG